MQGELRGLEKIKNDVQVMKMRNKLNMRVARYTAYKLRQELLTLKKELKKIRKEYKNAGKGADIPHIEKLTMLEMLNSHPAGRLIKKLTYEPLGLLILMGKSSLSIQKLISQQILTPEFDDNIFKEEFGDKTVTSTAFKAAEKSYMKRISAKLFDEDKFSPAKGEENISYLEKCRKDFKKACLRGIPLLPITLPITAIVLTTYAAFTLAGGVVWGGAWALEKVSNANARMLGKKTRGEVRYHDKFFGRKPKLFGDYKRVAFPVLQSAIAIVAAGAFTLLNTKDKDNEVPKVLPAIEQSVTPDVKRAKKEHMSSSKVTGQAKAGHVQKGVKNALESSQITLNETISSQQKTASTIVKPAKIDSRVAMKLNMKNKSIE